MLPKIVIVGRPNVGKSSILNMLARRKVSIVEPTAGVTRDRVATPIEIPPAEMGGEPHEAELIDTGGYGAPDPQQLTPAIEQQIARGLAEADLVLFVVDGQSGILPLDHTIAQLLRSAEGGAGQRRKGKPTGGDMTGPPPIVLTANKVDSPAREAEAMEALELGLGEPVMISATTGHNRHDLYDRLHETLDFEQFRDEAGPPDVGIRLAVVGKRNAGKSTLINSLIGDERMIVSDHEGTTRDSVDVRFEMEGVAFTAIDTAGFRRRARLADEVEYYAHHRALRSIRRAEVCLLLIDATVPISQVDRRLAQEINQHHRPVVVVVNKWDLAGEDREQEYAQYLDETLKGLNFAPIAFLSALTGEGLQDVLAMAQNLAGQAAHRVATGELNRVVERIRAERGPRSKGGKPAKIFYAAQLGVSPPTIALFVNDPDLIDANYQRFVLNRFRDELPFSEVPIKLLIRDRRHTPEGSSRGSGRSQRG